MANYQIPIRGRRLFASHGNILLEEKEMTKNKRKELAAMIFFVCFAILWEIKGYSGFTLLNVVGLGVAGLLFVFVEE